MDGYSGRRQTSQNRGRATTFGMFGNGWRRPPSCPQVSGTGGTPCDVSSQANSKASRSRTYARWAAGRARRLFWPRGGNVRHPAQRLCWNGVAQHDLREMGLRGVEPRTSRLSGVRSNHLSYRPCRTETTRERNRTRIETQFWCCLHVLPVLSQNRHDKSPRCLDIAEDDIDRSCAGIAGPQPIARTMDQ